MSLRHLLPIGRAFVPSGDRVGRYRPAEAGVVPDFSSGASRFRAVATAPEAGGGRVPEGGATAEVEVAEVGGGSVHPPDDNRAGEERGGSADFVQRSLSRPLPAPVTVVTGAGDLGASRARDGWWARIGQGLGTLLRPGNRRRSVRSVQTEMTFDGVKVARNDLMTADVEVVRLGAAGGTRATRLSAACRARLLVLWWDQGAERVRRLGNVFRKK